MSKIDELSKRLNKNITELNRTLNDIQNAGDFKVFISDVDDTNGPKTAVIVKVFSTTHGKPSDVYVIGHVQKIIDTED